MTLLQTRQLLRLKNRCLATLDQALDADELAHLFVSETRLDDVLELAASIASHTLPIEPDGKPSPGEIFLPGVRQCLAELERGELLSQAQHLLISVAEYWSGGAADRGATDRGATDQSTADSGAAGRGAADPRIVEVVELAKLCQRIRALQREQRRARMNMGKMTS